MDPVDYSEAKELLAKYSQRFAPTFSAPHRDLVAEMTTKVEDLDQVSGEIVDLVSRLDKLNHPSEPIPDGEGYDIITIGPFRLRAQRADPNVPIKRENSMMGYVRGGPADPFRTPEVRVMEGRLERATFTFYQLAHRVTHLTEKLPGLHSFECSSVRIVRNHLLEHPEGKSSGVTFDTFSYSTKDGPCVKGVRRDGQMQHMDQGFRKNSEEFLSRLIKTLKQAYLST